MSIKHMTAQNAQAIIDTFTNRVAFDRTNKNISAMLDALKKRLMAHAIDTTANQTETLMEIIDLIETTCNDHNLDIENEDYNDAIAEGEDPATLSKLYGRLYFELEDVARDEIFGN